MSIEHPVMNTYAQLVRISQFSSFERKDFNFFEEQNLSSPSNEI